MRGEGGAKQRIAAHLLGKSTTAPCPPTPPLTATPSSCPFFPTPWQRLSSSLWRQGSFWIRNNRQRHSERCTSTGYQACSRSLHQTHRPFSAPGCSWAYDLQPELKICEESITPQKGPKITAIEGCTGNGLVT